MFCHSQKSQFLSISRNSRSLPSTEIRETGRYESKDLWSLPSLEIKMVLADFHTSGKQVKERQAFRRMVRIKNMVLLCMKLVPEALFLPS